MVRHKMVWRVGCLYGDGGFQSFHAMSEFVADVVHELSRLPSTIDLSEGVCVSDGYNRGQHSKDDCIAKMTDYTYVRFWHAHAVYLWRNAHASPEPPSVTAWL